MRGAALAKQIYARTKSISDWCTQKKTEVLVDCLLHTRPARAVEIGVFSGQSAFVIALALQHIGQGALYAVDPWSTEAVLEGTNDPENDAWWASIDFDQIYQQFISLRASFGLVDVIQILRMKSGDASRIINREIDFLHIDGNHSEEMSTQDVRLWLPKTRPGGCIIFDDTNWQTTAAAQSLMLEFADEEAAYETFKVYRRR